jgi:hypothetical protein
MGLAVSPAVLARARQRLLVPHSYKAGHQRMLPIPTGLRTPHRGRSWKEHGGSAPWHDLLNWKSR